MRKKVLGTLAGLLAGAGGALAQTPMADPAFTPPPPLAPSGAFEGGGFRPTQFARPQDPVPPVMPGPIGGTVPTPGEAADFGAPVYPPPGPYGQQMYNTPRLQGVGGGLFGPQRSAPRVWVDAQYLLLFPRSGPVTQPLITTSAPGDGGALGRGTTTALWGNGDLSFGTASGFRLSGGFFRPQDQRFGAEISAIYASPVSNNFYGSSGTNGIPVIGRPFQSINTPAVPASLLTSFPTFVSGSILGRATSQFWAIDADGVLNLYRTAPESLRAWSFNLLAGFRYMSLEEGLNITSRSQVLPGRTLPYAGVTVTDPSTIIVSDDFGTRNRFYGGQVGFNSQFFGGRWFVGLTGKVAFGITHQRVDINGYSGLNNPIFGGTAPTTAFGSPVQPGVVSQAVGGLYAKANNIGTYQNDEFGIVTDLNANLGFNITSWLTATVGYNFIYMNSVARPGYQIDGRVDPTTVPTSPNFGGAPAARTPFTLRLNDYWIHGVNVGFNIRY